MWLEEIAPLTATQVRALQAQMEARMAEAYRALVEGQWPAPGWIDPGLRVDRQTAEARGEKLLREWLSPDQLAQYEGLGSFEVRGEATGTRYRLVQRRSYNVIELDGTGRARDVLCFLPTGGLVMGDQLLAQKVALETDERAALKVANRRSDDDPLMPCGCPEVPTASRVGAISGPAGTVFPPGRPRRAHHRACGYG
ncbi:hypothetical protein ACVWXN_003447 [Bradyrhizobium sp. i1.4.4]